MAVVLLLWSVPLVSAADTTAVVPQREARHVSDYLLAVPTFVLKLPVRVLGYMVQGPVLLVERTSLKSVIASLLKVKSPFGVRPVLGFKSRTGLKGGLKYLGRGLPGVYLPWRVKATVSTTQYRYAALRVGDDRLWGDRWGVQGEFGWRANTREPFYGIGPSSSVDDESNFGFRGVFGSARGFWQVTRPFGVELFTAFKQIKPEDGRDLTVLHDRDSIAVQDAHTGESLFGLFSPLDLYEIGVNLKLDWRRRPGSPLGGGTELLRVSYVTGSVPGDTTIGFWKIHGEATQYINLFGGRVIGLSVIAEHTEQDAGTLVPFYELSRLGGSRNLRGYKTGRFTAQDMVVFTAEYRWPLMRSVDAVLFTDQGRVFDDLTESFEFSNFRSSYGGGFRVWSGNGNAEILMAKGSEPLRVYFSLGESF